MEAEFCSSRLVSSYSKDIDSGDEELSVLPRDTKVIVKGNNRTKSVLVGLQGVVKKAVGLGGWHWLVSFLKPSLSCCLDHTHYFWKITIFSIFLGRT
jgi:hypothetical protein